MRTDQPPRVARWLLAQIGCSPNNDAVIGDLDERYRAGRSSRWYWRQTFDAIIGGLLIEVWTHKLLAIRAIVIGWCLWFVSRYAFNATHQLFFALEVWSRLFRHDWLVLAIQASELFLSSIFTGWIIASLHRATYKAMVIAYAAWFTGVHAVWFIAGLLIEPSGFSVSLLIYITLFIGMTTGGILIGGGVFSNRRDAPQSEEHPTDGLAGL